MQQAPGSGDEARVPFKDGCPSDWGDAESDAGKLAIPSDEEVGARGVAVANDNAEPTFAGIPLKWISLLAVTVQTSAAVLLIKWSKAEHREVPYLNSTVVFFTEVVKMCVSAVLVLFESSSPCDGAKSLISNFSSWDVLKAAVPSLIYAFQNNLTFYSLEYLSAAEMQVLYQMKVLTTAGMSVLVLGKVLNAAKWSACMMLVVGIAVVQWPQDGDGDGTSPDLVHFLQSGKVRGFLAVLAGCTTKAFASVFIEKLLKQTQASVWMRNVQFGLFGAIISASMAFLEDGPKIMEAGFIQGYDMRVVVVILTNANGGLLVAAMLKYAGATLGCFSTALSILLTCVISATVLMDFELDAKFLVGTAVTIGSAFLYELGLPSWLQEGCERCRRHDDDDDGDMM